MSTNTQSDDLLPPLTASIAIVADRDRYKRERDELATAMRDIKEWCANARLIAAAPDLLAALLFVSEHSYAGGKSFADIPIVRDALAKARGEQP